MVNSRGAKALFCAIALLALSACAAKGPPVTLEPPLTLGQSGALVVPEKTRLLVAEALSPNFGTNQGLFEARLRQLAQSCQIALDFFSLTPASGALALDPVPGTPRNDLNQRVQAFQPDGILEFRITGWSGSGALGDPNVQMTSGAFKFSLRLLDGKKRTEQWRTAGSLRAQYDTGGELLAQEIVRTFAHDGAFPHCPPSIQ